MFGLSINKIIFTVLIIVAVWRAWKLWGPLLQRVIGDPKPPPAQPKRPAARDARAVDLVACPHCGTFVPRSTACPSRAACRLQQG